MKITQFRKNGDTTALSVLDLEKLVNKVKTEIKSRPVSTFREELRYMLPDDRCMFADKLPGLDAVSFGPDLLDIHTVHERMSIASVRRTWDYLCEILRRLDH